MSKASNMFQHFHRRGPSGTRSSISLKELGTSSIPKQMVINYEGRVQAKNDFGSVAIMELHTTKKRDQGKTFFT